MSSSIIQGTYNNGHVELDESVDWAEGRRVTVAIDAESLGLRETDWPTDGEQLTALLNLIDSFEPVELTAADESEIEAARCAVSEKSLAAVREQMGLTP